MDGYLLFFSDKTPIVLDEDIKVYVRFSKSSKTGQHFRKIGNKETKVYPNTYIVNEDFEGLPQKYVGCDKHCINLNYATCCDLNPLGWVNMPFSDLFHAVIPKGTPFYYASGRYVIPERFNLGEIVSEKFNGEFPVYEMLNQMYIDKHYTDKTDSVNVGDFILNDKKTYLKYTQVNKDNIDNVIGIVVGFKKDGITPIISALHSNRKTLAPKKLDPKGVDIDSWKDSDDGYENTQRLAESGLINAFPGYKYCTNYSTKGTKAGDWYLPSLYELREFSKNYDLILAISLKLRFSVFLNFLPNYLLYNTAVSSTYSIENRTAYIKKLHNGYEIEISGSHIEELIRPFLKL